MNNICILGRLGKDVEITTSKDGKTIAKFSAGVNRKFNKEITDWFNCVSFGKQAEIIGQYFKKGDQIALSGEIQFGNYENKEGIKVYTTSLIVNTFDFCSSSSSNNKYVDNSNDDYIGVPIDDGDMPF